MRPIAFVVSLGLITTCGSSPARPTQVSPGGPPVLTAAAASITSISPQIAVAGSPDLTITVTGTHFVAEPPISTWVRWTAQGGATDVPTRVVSSTQGPFCWDGSFQGRFAVSEAGMNSLTGTYTVSGASDDCFNPGRTGTFAFVRESGS